MTKTKPLINALRINAIFSGLSAIFLLLAADWVAAQLGLGRSVDVYATGLMLVLFALFIGNIVRTGKIRRWEIYGIIIADLAWVIGSIAMVSIYFNSLTIIGLVLVDVVALAVLFFAVQQFRGLKLIQN